MGKKLPLINTKKLTKLYNPPAPIIKPQKKSNKIRLIIRLKPNYTGNEDTINISI